MNIIKIAIVIAIGILLQVLLIIADDHNTPENAAMEFTKAYFALDQDTMNETLCSELTQETDAVGQYVRRIEKESENTGFNLYSKSLIYNIHMDINPINDSEARVKISGKKRYSLNPVFTLVAIIFQIGEVDHFEKEIDLINENGQWKVCGNPFPAAM